MVGGVAGMGGGVGVAGLGGGGVGVVGWWGRVRHGWVCCNMMGFGNASTVHYMIDGALLADFPTILHRKKLAQIHRLGTHLLGYSYRFSSPNLTV
jgi:hypothetical protein